jgi:hypothetical protein
MGICYSVIAPKSDMSSVKCLPRYTPRQESNPFQYYEGDTEMLDKLLKSLDRGKLYAIHLDHHDYGVSGDINVWDVIIPINMDTTVCIRDTKAFIIFEMDVDPETGAYAKYPISYNCFPWRDGPERKPCNTRLRDIIYKPDERFEPKDGKKLKLGHIYGNDVFATYSLTHAIEPFNLPTVAVVREPKIVCPDIGRAYGSTLRCVGDIVYTEEEFDKVFPGNISVPYHQVMLVEKWNDHGDDGNLAYSFDGSYRLMTYDRFKEWVNGNKDYFKEFDTKEQEEFAEIGNCRICRSTGKRMHGFDTCQDCYKETKQA